MRDAFFAEGAPQFIITTPRRQSGEKERQVRRQKPGNAAALFLSAADLTDGRIPHTLWEAARVTPGHSVCCHLHDERMEKADA